MSNKIYDEELVDEYIDGPKDPRKDYTLHRDSVKLFVRMMLIRKNSGISLGNARYTDNLIQF